MRAIAFTKCLHIRGAYGLSGKGDLPIAEEPLAQAMVGLVFPHGRELLLPPHPPIDIANTIRITVPACRNFMTGGLPETKRQEHRPPRIGSDLI
jgi:hypothetical protein